MCNLSLVVLCTNIRESIAPYKSVKLQLTFHLFLC